MFGEAVNVALLSVVSVPFTFFCKTSCVPLMYALYQLFLSVQRNKAPMVLPLKLLMEPVTRTSASAAEGPSRASYVPLVLATCPVLLLMEKAALVLAEPPHVCPSDAVPQNFWLARWKVS